MAVDGLTISLQESMAGGYFTGGSFILFILGPGFQRPL